MFTVIQIAAFASGAAVFMTAEEGKDLGAAGLIQADPTKTDPTNPLAYQVTLTEAGQKAISASSAAPATPPAAPATPPAAPTAPVIPPQAPGAENLQGVGHDASATDNIGPVSTAVVPPAPKKRGGNSGAVKKSQYPFDQLLEPIKQEDGSLGYYSFPVMCEAGQDRADLLKKMSSNTSAANRRYEEVEVGADGQPVYETYEKKTFTKDAEGNFVKDENGKRVSTSEALTRVSKVRTRKFIARDMEGNDPEGADVRVFRVEL